MSRPRYAQTGRKRREGFSLLEIIATLLLSAILLALLLPMIGPSLRQSLGTGRATLAYNLRTQLDTWIELSRTTFAGDLPGLSARIAQDADGASFTLLFNDFITFVNGVETVPAPGATLFLRVTIHHPQSGTLTYVFTP